MNTQEFTELLENQYKHLCALNNTKGVEYARSDVDRLANFKRQAEELDMTPEKVLMVYLNKHLDAIKSFVKTGRVLSEPISGRISDAILYLILLHGLTIDSSKERQKLSKED